MLTRLSAGLGAPCRRTVCRLPITARALSCAVLVFLCASAASGQPAANEAARLARDGAAAIGERRFGEALEKFTEAANRRPGEPSLWLGAGVAAYMLGQNDRAEASLVRALRLNGRLVDAAELLGDIQYRSGRLADAIATFEQALEHSPDAPALAGKLEAWRNEARLTDRMYESRGAHFRVLFEGPKDDALARRSVEMLEAAYWRVGASLTAYPPQPITVVLYTLKQFRDITRAPDWAGGLYDGRIHIAVAGALERPADLEQVLAHEFVHAVVAMLGGRRVPHWLNEGLATALEPDGGAWASRVLQASAMRLPLARLHGGFGGLDVDGVYLAYAQSAAAVRRIIELRGASALVALLNDLKEGSPFEAAFHQRVAMRYEEFQAMTERR